MGTNTDTKLIEISPYMHQIGHSSNSRKISKNVQEGIPLMNFHIVGWEAENSDCSAL